VDHSSLNKAGFGTIRGCQESHPPTYDERKFVRLDHRVASKDAAEDSVVVPSVSSGHVTGIARKATNASGAVELDHVRR